MRLNGEDTFVALAHIIAAHLLSIKRMDFTIGAFLSPGPAQLHWWLMAACDVDGCVSQLSCVCQVKLGEGWCVKVSLAKCGQNQG